MDVQVRVLSPAPHAEGLSHARFLALERSGAVTCAESAPGLSSRAHRGPGRSQGSQPRSEARGAVREAVPGRSVSPDPARISQGFPGGPKGGPESMPRERASRREEWIEMAEAGSISEDIQVECSETSAVLRSISVEVDESRVGKAFDQAYGELRKTASIKGFRIAGKYRKQWGHGGRHSWRACRSSTI